MATTDARLDAAQMMQLLIDIELDPKLAEDAAGWLILNKYDKVSLLDVDEWDQSEKDKFISATKIVGGDITRIKKFARSKASGGGGGLSGSGGSVVPKEYPVGVVDPSPARYYVIERADEELLAFRSRIVAGGLYLFHAPRQSGKSTTILQLRRQFVRDGFEPIYVTMEYYSKKDHKTVYQLFSEYLSAYYPQLPKMIPTKSGFDNYFLVENFPKKRVLLFVDEFDIGLSLPDKNDLLVSLRLTQSVKFSERNALHAFVGLGTYGMIDLVGSRVQLPAEEGMDPHVSPFNLASFLSAPNFSRDEHKNLHIQQAGLPPEWEEDIWELTAGKAGASVWVGSQALIALRNCTEPNIAAWQQAKLSLISDFANTVTMKRMLAHIQNPRAKSLLHVVLRRQAPYLLTEDELKYGEQLAACGAAVMSSANNTIQASAPIIQQVILFNVDVIAHPGLRNASIPVLQLFPTVLDITRVLQLVVSEIDWKAVADEFCAKQCRVKPFRIRQGNDDLRKIADEQVFQTEVLIGLRALLCNREGTPIRICLPETKNVAVDSRTRLDVLIHNHSTYVLELCANVAPHEKDGIADHIAKAASYATAYNAQHCFCVNFVGFDFLQVDNWISAGIVRIGNQDVHLIHIRYTDTIAFPQEPVQDTQIIYGDNQILIAHRNNQ